MPDVKREIAVGLALSAVLIATSFAFVGAGHDDAWIMIFAGETLGKGAWFLNHNGVPQELSTSVLGALLAGFAARMAPSGDVFVVWKIVSWVPAIVSGLLFYFTLRKHVGIWAGVYWTLVLCCIPHWHYWAWGGLESGLFWLTSFLYAIVLTSYTQTPTRLTAWLAALVAAILPLVRADILWAPLLLIALGLFFPRQKSLGERLTPGIGACLLVLCFHVARYIATGAWFPNPAYAKAPFSGETLNYGLEYIYQFHTDSPFHVFLALAIPLSLIGTFRILRAVILPKEQDPGLFEWAGVLVVMIDVTTVLAGGDWMSYHRFAVRSLLLKLTVIALFISQVTPWFRDKVSGAIAHRAISTGLFLLALTGWSASGLVEHRGLYRYSSQIANADFSTTRSLSQYFYGTNIPLRRDTSTLVPWIDQELPGLVGKARDAQRLPLIVASYQAGFFPREIRQRFDKEHVVFIDLVGLSDYRIAQLPGWKTSLGLGDGAFKWAEAIAVGNSSLGKFLAKCRPDVVYVLSASAQEIKLMASAGYAISYQKTVDIDGSVYGATIFSSPIVRAGKKCEAFARKPSTDIAHPLP